MALAIVISGREYETVKLALLAAGREFVLRHRRLQVIVEVEPKTYLLEPDGVPFDGWHQVSNGSVVLISRQVQSAPVTVLEQRCTVHSSISVQEWFIARRAARLEPLLKDFSLHWMSEAEEQFARYDRRRDGFSLEKWLEQFDRMGDRKLGEMLARMLRVLDTSRLVSEARPRDLFARGQPRILGVGSRMGKSGARLSPLLRSFGGAEVYEFADAVEVHVQSGSPEPLHIFEDGLWTGIELKKVLDGLRGDGRGKVKPLKTIGWLGDIDIRLHYLLQTDLARAAAQELLQKEGLTRITIDPASNLDLPILTPEAKSKFEDGAYGFDDVERHRLGIYDDVMPAVRTYEAAWCDGSICERVGEMLEACGSLYTNKMDDVGASGASEPLCELPFGSNHIGSMYVFSHSAPRAAVPLYWRDGRIRRDRHSVQWSALVPEEP